MKKLFTYAVLVTLTLTVAAQTSRRQGSQTRNENQGTNNTRTETKSSTPKNSENNTYNRRSTDNRQTKTESDQKNSGNNKRTEPDYRNNNHQNTRSQEDHQVRKVEHRSSEVYHTDRVYVSPRTHVRKVEYNSHHSPLGYVYRNHSHVDRSPARVNIIWDMNMHSDYCRIYPFVRVWRIPAGTHISTISSYDAYRYVGDVKRVYGYVREVYYEPNSDEYHLYIGDYFPYQDFTVIVPGYVARQLSRRPYRYFMNQYIVSTGYITEYEDRPEMLIQRNYQIEIY